MKLWLRKPVVAAITFVLGCGVYFLSDPVWNVYRKHVSPLQYCQVARNADSYHNRNIVVKAWIIFDESGVYVYEDCDPTEALAASVVIDENYPVIGPAYVKNLLVSGDKPHLKTADVMIEGRFDAHATTGCWAPKFRIDAKSIEFVSGVTEYSPPQTESDGLRLKH